MRERIDGLRGSMTAREYLLAELRCTILRLRLMVADITAVGLALKASAITPEDALLVLHEADVPFRWIGTPPKGAVDAGFALSDPS